MRTTLKKVEHENLGDPVGTHIGKVHAINSIARAADVGTTMNDIRSTRPDVHVLDTNVVDHSTTDPILGIPPTVTSSTTVQHNAVPAVVSSGVISSTPVVNPTAVIVSDFHPDKKNIQDNIKAINDESNK